jgi:exosortase D (VPLPA-CTERM-specific)
MPRSKLLPTFLLLACLAAWVFLGWESYEDLFRRWWYEEEYGYGLLSGALFLYYLWQYRQYFSFHFINSRWSIFFAVTVLIVGLVIEQAGELSSSYFISQYGLLLTLFGLLLFFWNGAPIRLLLSIFVILALAIPIPYTLQAIFTVKLQLMSSMVGVFFIELLGVPVYLEGNVIDLGVYTLQVAEACSGLQYMYSLVCLAYIAGFFVYSGRAWARCLIVSFSIPLAILLNGARIAVAGFLVNAYGVETAEGFLHTFQGWVVFSVGIAGLLGFSFLVAQFDRSGQFGVPPRINFAEAIVGNNRLSGLLFSALVLLLVAIGLSYKLLPKQQGEEYLQQRLPLSSYPMQVNNWQGSRRYLSDAELSVLMPSDYLLAEYSSPLQQVPVELYVVYYESMEKKLSIHSPRVCLLGDGWEFDSFGERSFGSVRESEEYSINRVVIRRGEATQLLYYWYQQRGRTFANEFLMKWYLFVDSLLRGRKDGALVRMVTPVMDHESVADAEARLDQLLGVTLELLPAYIPD